MQVCIQLKSKGYQSLSAPPVLLGLMEVRGQLKGNRGMRRERLCAPDILVRDRAGNGAIEHAEHPEHFPRRPHQGNGQQLANFESIDKFQVRTRNTRGVLGQKDFLLPQRAGRDAIRKLDFYWPGNAIFDPPTNVEAITFQ